MSVSRIAASLLAVASLAGCGDDRSGADAGRDAGGPADAGPPDAGPPPPFTLTSPSFEDGGVVPTRHECGPPLISDGPGENVSPALTWTAGPEGTMSYALVVRDVDAGNLVHWVVYDIPADARALPEDVADGYELVTPEGAKQAELQGSAYFGYLGPCSPGRVNTYRFTLHALATPTLPGVDATTTEDAAAAAVEAMSIASASLDGES